MPINPTPSSTTQPQVPRVSPFERDYLRTQSMKILAAGGSEADVVNFVQTHRGLPLKDRVANEMAALPKPDGTAGDVKDGLISGLSLNALQGITFGFGDEALGSLMGVLSGEGAAGGIDEYRDRLRRWNAENPKKALGAELLGGFLTGGGIAKAAGMGLAKGAGSMLATVAAEGAAIGATAGAGYAEGSISDRAKAALFGGTMGALLGPLMAGGARVAGAAVKPVARAILDKLPERVARFGSSAARAEELLLDTFEAEGLTAEKLRQAALTMRANGVQPTLADIGGENALQLLGETLSTRTPVKQKLAEELLSRQAEQGGRLSGALFRKIMRSTNFGLKNAYDAVDELATTRATTAKPLYEAAYKEVVPVTPRMKKILSHPMLRAAWEEGRNIAATEEMAGIGKGLAIPELPALGLGGAAEKQLVDLGVTGPALQKLLAQLPDQFPTALPVRGLDYLKRGLDVVIKRGIDSKAVLDRQEVRALRALREELLSAADKTVPTYAQARSVWGGMSQAMDAVELGQQFIGKAPPVVQREIAELVKKSPGLADFYRLGAAQSLYEAATGAASRAEGADIANRIFGGRLYGAPNQDALRIQALFPDAPDVAQDFMRQVAAEARISHTAKMVGSGRTGKALQKFEEEVEGTLPTVRMSPALTLVSAIRSALVRGQGNFRQEISDDLASLFSRGVDNATELDVLLDKLSHMETKRLLNAKLRSVTRGGFGADMGLLTGKTVGGAR